RAAAAADFNGDGKPDLAVITGQVNAQGAVSLLLGNGDGSFRAPASTFVGGAPLSLAAGDCNGENKPVVAVSILDVNPETADVAILLGNGDGTLRAPT